MNVEREKTIASLSFAALSIDLLITLMIANGLVEIIKLFDVFWNFDLRVSMVQLFMIPVAMVLHLLVVEFICGGNSIGRLCTGLSVKNPSGSARLSPGQKLKRFASIFFSFGVKSVNLKRLPSYNNCEDCQLTSDWVGAAEIVRNSAGPSKPFMVSTPKAEAKAGVANVSVLSGPHAGLSAPIDKIVGSGGNAFVIGRDARKAHLKLVQDSGVSRVQCRIAKRGAHYLILDGAGKTQPSASGTRVNGALISAEKPTQIVSGSVIRVGISEILFSL